MALREPTRRQRRQPQPQRLPRPKDDLPPLPDDHEMLTFNQWCKANTISQRTGRKLRRDGNGPIFTNVSDKRIAVSKRNNRIWQASRARS